jgi:hypothetical protein
MRFLNSEKTAVMDHSGAVASAVAWLGNRYLLASPVRRLTHLDGAVPTSPPPRRASRLDRAPQKDGSGTLATTNRRLRCTS